MHFFIINILYTCDGFCTSFVTFLEFGRNLKKKRKQFYFNKSLKAFLELEMYI